MDKYEYKLKLDEIKNLMAKKQYTEAAEIADSINWRKVRNVNALMKAGDIYAQIGRYDEAKEILLMAYDRSPIGRMIIYKLAEIAIKTKEFDEAQEYYDEFVEIAPHDNLKYILRYEMNKAKGAGLDVLIQILEELKEQEYTEKWAFELAYLYHQAGRSEECINACDELILWFGDGPYVEKALDLKMLYQPLNRAQEDKYRQFKQRKDGIVEVRPEDYLESGEIIKEPVQIKPVTTNAEKFNTVNLQEELARSMQQIMNATEKEEVADTMQGIKKIVEEIPYLQLPQDEEAQKERFADIPTDEEIDGSLKINFQEMLGEDYDGQMRMVVPEKSALEAQITGQMSIQDILEEWEKTKRAAEKALQEAEQQKLESAKAKALAEAGDIMERLADVIPQLDAGLTSKELLEKEYDLLSEDEKRLYQRSLTRKGNYSLNQTAKNAGVKNFDKFHNSGYKGLYNGETADDIAKRKGLRYREDILDNMGSEELAANLFRITQTESRLKRDKVDTERKACDTHNKIGKIVRKAIRQAGWNYARRFTDT